VPGPAAIRSQEKLCRFHRRTIPSTEPLSTHSDAGQHAHTATPCQGISFSTLLMSVGPIVERKKMQNHRALRSSHRPEQQWRGEVGEQAQASDRPDVSLHKVPHNEALCRRVKRPVSDGPIIAPCHMTLS
jgi:hypothetical protein